MTKRRSTKSALLMSAISLLLCVSMLVGSTFAWFTDEVKSNNNIIKAGNLDVELYHSDKAEKNKKVDAGTVLFDDVKLWEPGAVAYEALTVANEGTLALKYQLAINISGANFVEDAEGNLHSLAEVLQIAVVDASLLTDRESAIQAGEGKWGNLQSFTESGKLLPAAEKNITIPNAPADAAVGSETYGIVIYWKPTANDNLFNLNNNKTTATGDTQMKITLGVSLFATQLVAENDSFGPEYDKDTAVFTVAEANAMLAENKPVTLVNCVDPNGVLEVPVGYDKTLTLVNCSIKSVQEVQPVITFAVTDGSEEVEAKPINIVILGDVVVSNPNGSAITGKSLNITGTGHLTAVGNGDFAYGIGGENTESINIEGITIDYVAGGHVQQYFVNDAKYGKTEPTGGAAIGSGHAGAEINLKGVTIVEALGGSKAAGIGARYWTGVTINIENCIINKVVGGNASAGIGGSRVSDNIEPAKQHVIINIKGSKINATGGQFGAGIGSGYDTHCGQKKVDGKDVPHITETICTINIDAASYITAQGGQHAAGVGTGYHVAALAGNIECEVYATAGESREKYTVAQAVGFGVVDHAREVAALSTAPTIKYVKNEIKIPSAQISNQADFAEALKNGESNIVLGAGTFTMPSTSKNVTITGTKDTKVNLPFKAVSGNGNVITFDGITIVGETDSSWYSELFNGATKVVYKNCEIYNQLTTYCDSEFVGCNFYNTFDNDYSVYCYSGKEMKFDDCSFDSKCSKAIKVYDEGNGGRKVYINDCTFTTETANKKAAVEIDSSKSTYYIYFTGNNVLNGAYTKLWNSDPGEDQGTNVYFDGNKAVADGLCMDDEGNYYIYNANGLMAFRETIGTWGSDTLAGKTINIMADIDATGKTWETAVIASGSASRNGFTFNGNGHTISNLTIAAHSSNKTPGTGLFAMNAGNDAPTTFKGITFDNVTVNGDVHTGILWGQVYGKIVVDNVHVINSNVTGTCNVGALIGRNGDDGVSEITFKDCSVKNTKVEATGTTRTDDKAGASAFLGMALKVEVNKVSVNLTFGGNNVSEGNTLTTANGYQGGGIYAISAWGAPSWTAPEVVNDFTNHN